MEKLKKAIRDIPDFPKQGIIFKDITTLLKRPDLLKEALAAMCGKFRDQKIDMVLGIEARGFIFGPAIACELGAGFAPVRKPGKLPAETISASYALEYGTDTIELHKDAVSPGMKVLIVDDLLATGGTAAAAVELVEKLGGEVAGLSFLVELGFLNGRQKIKGYEVNAVVTY
jgi:adenine phosphoribosyltransferase